MAIANQQKVAVQRKKGKTAAWEREERTMLERKSFDIEKGHKEKRREENKKKRERRRTSNRRRGEKFKKLNSTFNNKLTTATKETTEV